MLSELFNLDTRTLIGIAVWCNLALSVVMVVYKSIHKDMLGKEAINLFTLSRLLFMCGWFLLFYREQLPDILTVTVGNTLLFAGFFSETYSFMILIKENTRRMFIAQISLTLAGILLFTFTSFQASGNVRVFIASVVTIFIMFYPTLKLFTTLVVSKFSRVQAIVYSFLIISLFFRSLSSYYNTNTNLMTINLIQHITFTLIIIIIMVSGPVLLLFLKEQSDQNLHFLLKYDDLTKTLNRRHFIIEGEKLVSHHSKKEEELSLLFLDIDFFKKINDTFGHKVGDLVLTSFGETLLQCVRGQDLVARYGGEEFVVMLSHTDLEGAKTVATHIQDKIKKTEFDINGLSYRVSIGIYSTIPTESLHTLINKSDLALYEAKQTGRNKYCVYTTALEKEAS